MDKKKVFLNLSAPILVIFLLSCINKSQWESGELSAIEQKIIRSGGVKPVSEKPRTLHFVAMWKNEGKRQLFIENICQEFRLLNQDIDLKMAFKEEIPEIKNNIENDRVLNISRFISNQIQSGNIQWDIVPMLSRAMYDGVVDYLSDSDWGQKHLVDFKNVEGFNETQEPTVLNDPTFSAPYNGITLGPYIEGWYHTIYYNKTLAKQIDLDIRKKGMTADDLLSYIKKIHQYNQKNNTQISAFYDAGDWITLGIIWEQLYKSAIGFSKDIPYPDGFTQQQEQAFFRVLKFFETMSQYDPLIPSARQNQWSNTQDLVLNDQAVFYVNGTWMVNIWEQIDSAKVEKMVPCELPVFEPISFYPGIFQSDYAVLKNSPRKNTAIKFLMFLATKDVAEDWVQLSKSPTGIKRHFSNSSIGQDAHQKFLIHIDQKYKGQIDDYNPNIFGLRNQLEFAYSDLHQILFKEKTAEELFNQYKARLLQK